MFKSMPTQLTLVLLNYIAVDFEPKEWKLKMVKEWNCAFKAIPVVIFR